MRNWNSVNVLVLELSCIISTSHTWLMAAILDSSEEKLPSQKVILDCNCSRKLSLGQLTLPRSRIAGSKVYTFKNEKYSKIFSRIWCQFIPSPVAYKSPMFHKKWYGIGLTVTYSITSKIKHVFTSLLSFATCLLTFALELRITWAQMLENNSYY